MANIRITLDASSDRADTLGDGDIAAAVRYGLKAIGVDVLTTDVEWGEE